MKFNVAELLKSAIGYKGIPFPGAFFPSVPPRYIADDYTAEPGSENEQKTHSNLGSLLRKRDAQGKWYFLPVIFEHKGKEYEIPNAVISLTGKKTIVETPLTGRKGTVKELISVNDYEISIAGVAIDADFPETQIAELNELYNINEAVTLKCALTDIFMEEEDKVVIKSLDFAEMKGTDTAQLIKISAVTDRSFELIIN
jgi:hypothetical protein